MNDILNEKRFLEEIRFKIKEIYGEIDSIYDLIIERIDSKKKIITKFEKSVEEYEYESISKDEIDRAEKFGEAIKEIIGI
jgi:hypothetical protein